MDKQYLLTPLALLQFVVLALALPLVSANASDAPLTEELISKNYLTINRSLQAVAVAGACSAHLPGWERVFAPPVINSVSATSPTDCGANDGTITIDATGDSPLEYSINFGSSWQPDPNFTDLPAGDYTVLVRNIGEMTEVAYINNPVQLVDPAAPTIFGVTQTNPSTCTDANGILSVGALPGVGSPEYSIDGGENWQASGSFPNLTSGNYEVYARNDNGTCIVAHTNNPIELFAAAAPSIQSVTAMPSSDCEVDDGEIVIVGTGSGPLQYSIDNGNTWRAVNTFDDLAPGAYEVVIQNNDGTCMVPYAANPVIVTGPVTPVFVAVVATDISDCGAADGSIEIHTDPGVGVLEYSIDGGTTWLADSSFTNLVANTYNIRVRYLDESCPLDYRSNPVVFTDPSAPVIVAIDSIDPTGCGGVNGEISFLATGDRDLLYSINGGTDFQADPVFSNLPAGNYDPLVSYAGGACTASSPSITLTSDASATFILGTNNASGCLDASGSYALSANDIRVNGAGLGAGYGLSYSSTDGTFDDNTDPNTNFNPTTNIPGTYTIDVTVTDLMTACAASTTMNFEVLASPVTNMMPDSICLGEGLTLNSGTVGVHTWSVISGDASSLSCTSCPSPVATPNETTVYGLSVTNPFSNSCETTTSVEIFLNPAPTVINPIANYGLCSGNSLTISLELSEDITGYSIVTFDTYNNAMVNDNILTLDAVLDGSNTANYRIDFIGESGCEVSHSFSVDRIADPIADFTYTAPTCAESDIVFQFIGAASANANLTWELDGGNLLFSSPMMGMNPAGSEITASWPGLGTYSIILIVEEGGCTARDTQDIMLNATAPQTSSLVTPASSCGTSPGAIDLTATGADNVFAWEGPAGFIASSEDIANLELGFYSVTVTDTVTTCNTIQVIEVMEDGLFNCTDHVRVLIPAIDPYSLCLDDVVNLPAPITTASVCGDDPATITVAVNPTDDCITLDPNDSFVGEDIVCVVHCDGNAPQNCDTTFLTVMVSPPTDTIQVNILGDIASEVCIDASALQIGTTITSSTFCDTGNPATVQATAVEEECVILNAANGFLGLSPDLICVINCYDNFALFCDTTYIEVTVDPNNCTDPIVEENISLPLPDCNALTSVCLSIPFSSIGNYEIIDNGMPYGSVPQLCGTDSTELLLSQGGHLLIFREMATGCPDTVLVDLDNGLDLYAGPTDFEVGCDSILSICLDIPFLEVADYQIMANGMALPTDGCGLDSFYVYDYSQIPDQGAVGPYLLQSWTVNGSVFIGNFNNIPELVDSMNVWDPSGNWSDDPAGLRIVGGDFNTTYSATMEVSKVIGGSGSIVLGVDYRPSNIAIELDTGYHEVILTYLPTNCFERIEFNINCITEPECQDLFTTSPVNLNVDDCADLAAFCIGIDAADLADYNFFDNGNAYSGNFPGCNEQSILSYPFAAIPGQGNAGPYTLTSWSVGISIYSGITFSSLTELVNAMNGWDPAGNWMVNGTSIEGGAPNSGYGAIQIEFNTNNYPVFPMTLVVASSVAVELDTGYHQVIVEYLPTGCRDTVDVNVNCVECTDFILVESTTLTITDCTSAAAFCVAIPFADINDYSITDNNFPYFNGRFDCPGSGGTATQLNLNRGIHELVFTEIATGCTDTVEVIVNCVSSSTQEIELLVNTLDTLCADNTELLGTIISNANICEDASGEMVIFTAVPGTFCYEVQAIEVGSDTACIVLCDDTVCDTTYLIVNVVEELTPDEELPVAVADATTTLAGQAVSYNVLANDSINGTLDTFQILNQPDNGFAWYDSTGTIHYQPDAEFCDFANPEMIAYEICNENGCDTTELLVTVICDDLKTFSGFSPNGDGKNDTFIIQGAEAYPNNRLLIFSRWGTLIFEVDGYLNNWDGSWEGVALPEGTYFYLFDTGEGLTRSGYLQIHR